MESNVYLMDINTGSWMISKIFSPGFIVYVFALCAHKTVQNKQDNNQKNIFIKEISQKSLLEFDPTSNLLMPILLPYFLFVHRLM
jgi:hypothetical protein